MRCACETHHTPRDNHKYYILQQFIMGVSTFDLVIPCRSPVIDGASLGPRRIERAIRYPTPCPFPLIPPPPPLLASQLSARLMADSHSLPRLPPHRPSPTQLFDFFEGNNAQQAHSQVYNVDPNNDEHKSKLSHELIAGAAAFEAARAYEQHCAKNGQPPNHQMAKEIIAGLAGAEIDKLFESKGLNAFDREKGECRARLKVWGPRRFRRDAPTGARVSVPEAGGSMNGLWPGLCYDARWLRGVARVCPKPSTSSRLARFLILIRFADHFFRYPCPSQSLPTDTPSSYLLGPAPLHSVRSTAKRHAQQQAEQAIAQSGQY